MSKTICEKCGTNIEKEVYKTVACLVNHKQGDCCHYGHARPAPTTPTPTDLDNSIIGCCGGGLNRHEVCSHVKDYIQAEIVKARINELERQEFQDVMMLYAEYETREVVKNRIAELSNKEQNYDR